MRSYTHERDHLKLPHLYRRGDHVHQHLKLIEGAGSRRDVSEVSSSM